jgi:hypothetical protein
MLKTSFMRAKKRELILYNPSTHERLYCLADNPKWPLLLLGRNKKYDSFLQKLSERNFYNDPEGKISIKQIAAELGFKTTDVTQWITAIYDDIYDLNETEPELFRSAGVRHDLYFKHYDDRGFFTLWMQQTPREFEGLSFYFIKAKVGTNRFWVKEVRHELENGEYKVHLTLDGQMLNKYRELLVDKGLFQQVLSFGDIHNKHSFEIDKELLEWYRH